MEERVCKVKKVMTIILCLILTVSLCTFAYAENEQINQETIVLENEEDIQDEAKEVEQVEDKNEEMQEEKKDVGETKKKNTIVQKKSPTMTLSDTDIKIDTDHFPDETFRTYLLTNYDYDDNEILSENEITSITELDITDPSYENISNLTGVEYLTSLEWLRCSGTNIKKLDLTQVPSIRIVECDECSSLTNIDVTNCKNLEQLRCGDTQISKVDVTTCPKLDLLDCSHTNLSSIDVRQNLNLVSLYLNETPITSIDVSQNMELAYLECNRSKVTSIDVSNHEKLETLYCYLSDVTDVKVDNCPNLYTLLVGYTKIKALDITTCPELMQLYCTGTAITEIDVSQNPNLYDLELNWTNLTSLDVSHNPELSLLWCQGTKLSTLNVTHNPQLESLHCYNTPLYSLDVGNHSKTRVIKGDSMIDIGEIEETFNITDKFPDIDVSKVEIVSGATLDSNTGIVSHYKEGIPIVYTYDSGEVKEYYTSTKKGEVIDEEELDEGLYQHGPMSLKVTLTFTLKQKEDKPETGNKPSTGDKPETGNKPNIGDKPETGNKPNIGDKPETGNKPSTGDKPEIGDKPSIEDKPKTEDNPSVEGNLNTGNTAKTGDELYLDLWAAIFMTSVGMFVILKRKKV